MTFYTKQITAKCFEQKLSFITKTRENHTRESHQSHEVPRGTGDNLLTILTSIVTSFLFISEDNLKDNNYLITMLKSSAVQISPNLINVYMMKGKIEHKRTGTVNKTSQVTQPHT